MNKYYYKIVQQTTNKKTSTLILKQNKITYVKEIKMLPYSI